MKKNVYICDICGKEMKWEELRYFFKKPRIHNSEYSWAVEGLDKTQMDLCPECWRELQSFVSTKIKLKK